MDGNGDQVCETVTMVDALANADIRNLFVAAKRHSARSLVLHLGEVAESFAARYDAMDATSRESLRAEYPGSSGKTYKYGWLGAWQRMLDTDPEVAGDASLSARTMVRYLKFHPIAAELARRERTDAIPCKLGASCVALQRALTTIDPPNGTAPPDAALRGRIIGAVADGFVVAFEEVGRPLNGGKHHAAVLDEAIERACATHGVQLLPGPTKKPAAKRSRDPEPESKNGGGGDLDADCGHGADADADADADAGGRGDGNGGKRGKRESDGDGDVRGSDESDAAAAIVARLANLARENPMIASAVAERVDAMIPELADVVRRDFQNRESADGHESGDE